MKQAKIISGIDIGTSKISVVICQLKSANDIEILGLGTSVLKNVQKGLIRDESLFVNALQNAIKRAQVASGCLVKDIFVNVHSGNKRFTIETGIVHCKSDHQPLTKDHQQQAMKKSVHCIDKKNQSVLHLLPIYQRIDGQHSNELNVPFFNQLEVDTGVILCDTANLKMIHTNLKKLGFKINGVISDYLAMGAMHSPNDSTDGHLMIDIGAQVTSFCVYSMGRLQFAHSIDIGSEQITKDLSICLKCSLSEAERIKVLHGQVEKISSELGTHIPIHCHDGQKMVKLSLITSIIESRINQLFQFINKYLIHAPSFANISLIGSGANLTGLPQWVEKKLQKERRPPMDGLFSTPQVNSNYMIAMGQIIYGHRIGLLKNPSPSFFQSVASKLMSFGQA